MAQKYVIFHETEWNEREQKMAYKRLTTFKNEKEAIKFVNDIDNIGTYGNMIVRTVSGNGEVLVYDSGTRNWSLN